jgi:hypothetical protein
MGLLGMDVLKYYCIQLDFAAGKVRFLDDEHADKKTWGQSFPLTDIGDGCFSIHDNLAGLKGRDSLVDTRCDASGWLRPEAFRQWTNQESAVDGRIYSPDGTPGGEMYHDLDLLPLSAQTLASDDEHIKFNGVGLSALAENVVTFDFPKRTMYLRHTSDWPLPARDAEAEARASANSSFKAFKQLLKSGRLPGVSKHQPGKTTAVRYSNVSSPYLDTVTYDARKMGDSSNDHSLYHFTFTRTAKNGPWKLQKPG